MVQCVGVVRGGRLRSDRGAGLGVKPANAPQTFGSCLRDLIAENGWQMDWLTEAAGYKSKTSVLRILREESSARNREQFFRRIDGLGLLRPEARRQLQDALEVSALGAGQGVRAADSARDDLRRRRARGGGIAGVLRAAGRIPRGGVGLAAARQRARGRDPARASRRAGAERAPLAQALLRRRRERALRGAGDAPGRARQLRAELCRIRGVGIGRPVRPAGPARRVGAPKRRGRPSIR